MTLIVARDRGHVDNLRSNYLDCEIITASVFFDRIRHHAFMKDKHLKKDDYAPAILLSALLSMHDRIHHLPHFLSLFSACFHGMKSPKEVYQAIRQSSLDFIDTFFILKEVEEAMEKHHLATSVQALFYAFRSMINDAKLPLGFMPNMHIEFFHLVDLTMLEINILKSLSRLNVKITLNFLWDFHERGINGPVNFIAQQFESCADLANIELIFQDIDNEGHLGHLVKNIFSDNSKLSFFDDEVSLLKANSIVSEAEIIAQKIALIKAKNPYESIALSVRSLDDRALIYKQALLAFNIFVRDRKGVLLLDSPAGLLLLALLKLTSLTRKDLLGLMLHPCFTYKINDNDLRAAILLLIDQIGLDDHIDLYHNNLTRYLVLIDRFMPTVDDENKDNIIFLQKWLMVIDENIIKLQEKDTIYNHITNLKIIINNMFIKEDNSVAMLLSTIDTFISSIKDKHDHTMISLKDFITLIKSLLINITLPPKDCDDADAVWLLPLPELLGKNFDHVFIADISIGHMPKNPQADPLMNDEARIALNRYLGMPLLRVFFDDPFEPAIVPPRQALEPLWFLSAIASAKKYIHFSYAEHDDKNQEQAPSEFFLWLSSNLSIESRTKLILPMHANAYHFNLARHHIHNHAQDMALALGDRNQAYKHNHAGAYAFSFNEEDVLTIFAGRLDQHPRKPLTPSLIEAFIPCRFRGFLQRMIDVKRMPTKDDVEALIIGQIAHSVLESYFSSKHHQSLPLKTVLKEHIDKIINNYISKNFVKNMSILKCHAHELSYNLAHLIENMQNMSSYQDAKIIACEKDFYQEALVLNYNDNTYLVSGRVDRIDQINDDFLVTDYKLSKTESLNINIRNALLSNMQLPIYLRLVSKNMAHDINHTYFAYASISDGQIILLSPQKHRALYDAINNDDHEKSLPKILYDIFNPVSKGHILATPSEHCLSCDFSYICRAREQSHV